MLVLSGRDVETVLTPALCIDAMAQALTDFARQQLFQPSRVQVQAPGASSLMGLMPAFRGGTHPLWSLKDVVVAPGNPARGLDAHQGAVLLHDGTTGVLRAVVDASALTAVRTAAVSAVATRALARAGCRRIAILGTGTQARAHAAALRVVHPDATLVVWGRTAEHVLALSQAIDAEPAATLAEATRRADVICVCTGSAEPLLDTSQVQDGTHINAVGACAPTRRELASALVARCEVFVDSRQQAAIEAGDLLIPQSEGLIGPDVVRAEIGEVLAGFHPGRGGPQAVTLFKSLGLAIEDLAAAEQAVLLARERGLGIEVPFGNEALAGAGQAV